MFSIFSKSKYQIAKSKAGDNQFIVKESDSGTIIFMGSKEMCKKFVENRELLPA